MTPYTMSNNQQQQRATAGVVAPRTTSNLHQRAPAGGDEPPKTSSSSWCMVERATATYDYVVTEYSKLHMVGVGQYVSSDAFRAGGHDWTIRLYPKQAQTQGIADHLRVFPVGASLHLCDADEDTQIWVRFTLSVLQRDGRVSPMASRTAKASFGSPPDQLHGFHMLFDRTRLRPWRCVHNDAFTIRCTLTVMELTSDPGRLLDSGKGADVTFQVRGRAFPAHRFILADRSPVLLGDMMEKAAPCIKIAGMRPEVFELLLRFIYTDALPGDGEGCDAATMQRLLVAADRYGLDRLKHICELKLHASVDAEPVASEHAACSCGAPQLPQASTETGLGSPRTDQARLEVLTFFRLSSISRA